MSVNVAEIQRRACTSKVQYGLKEWARTVARRTPKKEGRKAKAYLCPFAPAHLPHFHVGHDLSDRKGRLNIDYESLLTSASPT